MVLKWLTSARANTEKANWHTDECHDSFFFFLSSHRGYCLPFAERSMTQCESAQKTIRAQSYFSSIRKGPAPIGSNTNCYQLNPISPWKCFDLFSLFMVKLVWNIAASVPCAETMTWEHLGKLELSIMASPPSLVPPSPPDTKPNSECLANLSSCTIW